MSVDTENIRDHLLALSGARGPAVGATLLERLEADARQHLELSAEQRRARERLQGPATFVQILPFCPYASDDGLAVGDDIQMARPRTLPLLERLLT